MGSLARSNVPRPVVSRSAREKPVLRGLDGEPWSKFGRSQSKSLSSKPDPITKSIPYAPLSHLFIERLIGTLRREFLDHVLFRNTRDLDRKLDEFRDFYNCHRVHASLGGDTPMEFSGETVINITDLH